MAGGMREPSVRLHQSTPVELRERLAAERRGVPFLVMRDDTAAQRIIVLTETTSRVSIGRSGMCDIALTWDSEVSRLHAELERTGDQWLIVDDGLSSNGSFVAGEQSQAGRRLRPAMSSGSARPASCSSTLWRGRRDHPLSGQRDKAVKVTEAQKRVLVALCRPYKHDPTAAVPATNPEIADELYLSVAAVKTHLRGLFHAFEIEDLPPQAKRRTLVALRSRRHRQRPRSLAIAKARSRGPLRSPQIEQPPLTRGRRGVVVRAVKTSMLSRAPLSAARARIATRASPNAAAMAAPLVYQPNPSQPAWRPEHSRVLR